MTEYNAKALELLKQYRENKSDEILMQLISMYIGLVKKNVQRYHSLLKASYDEEDLISEGVIGLIKAFDSYDEEKDAMISTYVGTYIDGYMLNFLRKNFTSIRFPAHIIEKYYVILKELIALRVETDDVSVISWEDIKERAKKNGCTDKEAYLIMRYAAARDEIYYNAPCKTSDGEEGDLLVDFIPSELPTPENIVIRDDEYDILRKKIKEELTSIEAEIITAYYGIDCEPASSGEIAKRRGCSSQYVLQVINNSLRKLRKAM